VDCGDGSCGPGSPPGTGAPPLAPNNRPFTPPRPTPVSSNGGYLPFPAQPYSPPVTPVGYQDGYQYGLQHGGYPYMPQYGYPAAPAMNSLPMGVPSYWYR
jgi:hypothetical protein